MAIDQATVVNPYSTQKANYWTQANTFITAIGLGDVIAYKNNDDGMFYAVKVTNKQMFMNNDVILTVKGVRFKFEQLDTVNTSLGTVNYTNIGVGDIFYGGGSTGGSSYISDFANGICQNGKLSAMSGGNDPQGTPGTPSACISYAEFFDKEELTISGLLHAGTPKQTDDIIQITVLPDNPPRTAPTDPHPSYTNGTQAINKIDSGGTEPVLNGIARQLAWNFRFSVA